MVRDILHLEAVRFGPTMIRCSQQSLVLFAQAQEDEAKKSKNVESHTDAVPHTARRVGQEEEHRSEKRGRASQTQRLVIEPRPVLSQCADPPLVF